MSRKRKKEQEAERLAQRGPLLRRRIFLGTYLAFLGACLVGCLGPWWTVYVGESQRDMKGPDYMRYEKVTLEPDEVGSNPFARMAAEKGYMVRKEERTFTPAVIAVLAICVAFLAASTNLVTDSDVQIPGLLATLVIVGVAGYVLYDVWYTNRLVDEFVEEAVMTNYKTEDPRIEMAWGGALFLSSALVLLVNSLILTGASLRSYLHRKKQQQ